MVAVRPWILAARGPTLTAAVAPVVLATCALRALGYPYSLWLSACALACAIFIQVGTNLFNDAIDFTKGADTGERLGPPRAAQLGLLTTRALQWGAIGSFAAALVFCVPLVAAGGPPILYLGLASLLCGYAYTGGPFPLAYLGLGELFVVLFFGLAAVVGTGWFQAHTLDDAFIVGGVQIGLLAAVMIAINNFRDASSDRACGKRTLAARFGDTFARGEITLFLFLPFALGAFWIARERRAAALLPLALLPWAVKIAAAIWRETPGRHTNRLLKQSAGLHLLFSLLAGAGLLW